MGAERRALYLDISELQRCVKWAHDDSSIGIETNMCDVNMKLNRNTGRVEFQLYDKALHLGDMSARMLKYPLYLSQQAWGHKIGIIKSQLSRIYNRSDHEDKFVRDAMRMILRVRWNGISAAGIKKSIRTWKPRMTIHLPWRANDRTVCRLLQCLDKSEYIMSYSTKKRMRQTTAGVTNRYMEEHLKTITREW